MNTAIYAIDLQSVRRWPACACTVASLSNGRRTRDARLNISFGPLVQETHWGVRCWEQGGPSRAHKVDWLLDSPEPVLRVEDALRLLCSRTDLVTRLGCR
jgi:hypothetical protein